MQIFFWILAILVSLGIGYWVYLADRRREVPYPWLTALMRTLLIFLTCLLLLAPAVTITRNETQKPVIVFLQDNSQSVATALKDDSSGYRQDATELLERLSEHYRVIRWGFGNHIQRDTLFAYTQQATDIASALAQTAEFYGQQNLGAVILASDGRFNQGLNPQFQDISLQGRLFTVALGDSAVQKDIRVMRVYANKTVALNSQFEIRADILARQARGHSGTVRLTEANGGSESTTAININNDNYDRGLSFTVRADRAGLHHYIISVSPVPGEQNTENNRADVFVEVVNEKKNILIAANAPHPDINAIREALSGLEGYQVTVRTGDRLPASFEDYQVVILHSLPSMNNPLRQLSLSKKPVWYIVGAMTHIQAVNNLQQLAVFNVNTANLQNVFSAYNTGFSAFTLPRHIQAVLDKMPPLATPAGTLQQNPSAEVLFHARGNAALPVWMLQQGASPAAVLLGEGLWRWRLFEYRHFNAHQVIDEAIRQTVSFLAANVKDKPFQVNLPKYLWSDQEAVTLNAYLLNANNEQVNTPEVKLTITDSAGTKQQYTLERSGNGYRLNLGVRASGAYRYIASTSYGGRDHSASGSFAVRSMPLEMMETGADYPLLHALAGKYSGSLVPQGQVGRLYDSIRNDQGIQPLIQSVTQSVPLVDWKWYFFLIILVAVAEWLLRKYWLAQ